MKPTDMAKFQWWRPAWWRKVHHLQMREQALKLLDGILLVLMALVIVAITVINMLIWGK